MGKSAVFLGVLAQVGAHVLYLCGILHHRLFRGLEHVVAVVGHGLTQRARLALGSGGDLGGALLGSSFEFLCSWMQEVCFGMRFWDYSHLPLNIGGRTNVLYCIFWGLLAVAWIKVLYPPMSKGIEKIPALLGKVITWVIIFFLACDGLLTGAAMLRYTERQNNPEPKNVAEAFLDNTYDDDWMEHHWPNMVVTKDAE